MKEGGKRKSILHTLALRCRPLLQLQLEVRFEKIENVKVTTFDSFSELELDDFTNGHICLDEVHEGYIALEDLKNISAKSIWIAIRDTKLESPEEYLKENLQEWDIVNLKYPLRTSKNISKIVKDGGRGNSTKLHSNAFNGLLEVTC